MYSCHHFLISPVSVGSLSLVYFGLCPSLHELSLGISNFREEIANLFHCIFSSISLYCSFKKAFLSHPATLWNCIQSGIVFPFSFAFPFSFFSAIFKTSSDNYFASFHFFFFGMVLIAASCTMLQSSIHSSLGILYIRSNPLNLFVTSTL